jgi:pimeloyl-ACP methyl ester carboxylesterase
VSTFILIHGGGHRGWHWHLVEEELRRRGHTTVAPDVPMSDPDVGAAEWAAVAARTVEDSDDDVIAVGHSYAGLMLPVLACIRPLRRMVFVAANVPDPGRSYAEYMADPANLDAVAMPPVEYDDRGRITLTFQVAREVYYGDVSETVAREAWERLTPNATTGFTEPCPIDTWPDTPASYVLCTEDLIIPPPWSRRVSAERLGTKPIELSGGHSPMLSRPKVLADVLDKLSHL